MRVCIVLQFADAGRLKKLKETSAANPAPISFENDFTVPSYEFQCEHLGGV